MKVDEIRAIREKTSLETIGMTTEELRIYFAQGATDIERRIAKIRKKKGIVIESRSPGSASKSLQKNEHVYIRGAEYYSRLSSIKADNGRNTMVQEAVDDYDQQ